MKSVDKKKPVHTIPEGVWESSRPAQEQNEKEYSSALDLQGNGYPAGKANTKNTAANSFRYDVEPLPESSRPRKDGPGGD